MTHKSVNCQSQSDYCGCFVRPYYITRMWKTIKEEPLRVWVAIDFKEKCDINYKAGRRILDMFVKMGLIEEVWAKSQFGEFRKDTRGYKLIINRLKGGNETK